MNRLLHPIARAAIGLCLWLVIGCSDPVASPDGGTDGGPSLGDVGADAEADDAPALVDAGPDAGDGAWGAAVLRAEYGILETLAGAGEADDNNGWLATYEGGDAVDAELSRPHTALGDGAGNVYITDKEAHAIRRVDASGTITTVAGTNAPGFAGDDPAAAIESPLSSPNGLWVHEDGTLYILDLGNDRVRRVSVNGQMTTLFVIGGAGTGRGLWVAPDESVAYVAAGSRLLRWTPGGGVETLAQGFVSLGNVHVSPDGDLGVTDRGGHRAYLIDEAGERTPIAGNGTTSGGGDGMGALETGLNEVRGIWFHPRGGYLLATHRGCQVWFVDPVGAIHLILDGENNAHSGDGLAFDAPGKKISEPRAVAMDFAGNILVTELDEGHVRRIVRN